MARGSAARGASNVQLFARRATSSPGADDPAVTIEWLRGRRNGSLLRERVASLTAEIALLETPASEPGWTVLRREVRFQDHATTTSIPRRIIATNTTAHTASATQIQTRAKLVIAPAWAAAPTTKLQAAYMPNGNTVDQRRTS
jgi:hypothetical protein